MKKLVFLMIVSFGMLFSCSKDVLNDENTDLKKAKVPIPFKMEFCMNPNPELNFHVENTPFLDPASGEVIIPDLYMVHECWLSGYGTHFGELIKEQSSMTAKSAYLDLNALLTEHKVVTVAVYEFRITAANGDYCDGISHIRIDWTNHSGLDIAGAVITGDVELLGGIGKFEDASGTSVLNGILPCWHTEGTLEYPR